MPHWACLLKPAEGKTISQSQACFEQLVPLSVAGLGWFHTRMAARQFIWDSSPVLLRGQALLKLGYIWNSWEYWHASSILGELSLGSIYMPKSEKYNVEMNKIQGIRKYIKICKRWKVWWGNGRVTGQIQKGGGGQWCSNGQSLGESLSEMQGNYVEMCIEHKEQRMDGTHAPSPMIFAKPSDNASVHMIGYIPRMAEAAVVYDAPVESPWQDTASSIMQCLYSSILWQMPVVMGGKWSVLMDIFVEFIPSSLHTLWTFQSNVWWLVMKRVNVPAAWSSPINVVTLRNAQVTVWLIHTRPCNACERLSNQESLIPKLHKGIFHDHLVQWCISIVSEKEVDACFQAMTQYPALCHFKKGISSVSQWTGTEHKEMQRVFVSLLASAVEDHVLMVAHLLLDFIYYAQLQQHTDTTLAVMEESLKTFHDYKHVLVELEVCEDFKMPKIHSMQHYISSICALGSADGYNTKYPK
ncbi:hypothetical protein EDC04DRAFT_2615032 [Pisolithus marmoratus]|nr:hypothetical protein EDC04DRAFT_2615032 [Pisolithus marmoratus]